MKLFSKQAKLIVGAASGALALAAVCGPVSAQMYKGKTVTMIINYPAGAPTDIEGRIVAQYLPKHLPGSPTVIVKNVGGGGGMIGTNNLGEIAKPDGMTIGFFTWNIISAMLGDPGLQDLQALFLGVFVGGVRQPRRGGAGAVLAAGAAEAVGLAVTPGSAAAAVAASPAAAAVAGESPAAGSAAARVATASRVSPHCWRGRVERR